MTAKSPFRAGRDMDTLIENVELLTGQRGDGRYAATTQSDLARLKLAKAEKQNGKLALVPGVSVSGVEAMFAQLPPQTPDRPQRFETNGAFTAILLEWQAASYRGHDYTEVWRFEQDNLADATLVGTTVGQVYSDPVDPGWKGYYWIRFANKTGTTGPWNALSGTPAETVDVDTVFEKVEQQISRSPLIKGINDKGEKAFLDMWQPKASAAGITAGIGLVAGKTAQGQPISQVAISATDFFVYDPNDPTRKAYPFVVKDGKVAINSVVIRDATIKAVNAMSLTADYVRAGVTLSSPVLRSAEIQAGRFTVSGNGNLNAQSAQMQNTTARGVTALDLSAVRGTLSAMRILDNCTIDGTLTASAIEGDILKVGTIPGGGSYYISPAPYERLVFVMGGDASSMYNVSIADGKITPPMRSGRLALTFIQHKSNRWAWWGFYTLGVSTPASVSVRWGSRYNMLDRNSILPNTAYTKFPLSYLLQAKLHVREELTDYDPNDDDSYYEEDDYFRSDEYIVNTYLNKSPLKPWSTWSSLSEEAIRKADWSNYHDTSPESEAAFMLICIPATLYILEDTSQKLSELGSSSALYFYLFQHADQYHIATYQGAIEGSNLFIAVGAPPHAS